MRWPQQNPFATRAIQPGATPYLFPANEDARQLVERLRELHWQGEIVGPHGAGKSTLLAALSPALEAAGRRVVVGRLRAGERSLPREILDALPWDGQTLLIVDGYEQLGWLRQRLFRLRRRWAGCGLLVTSHVPTGLPTLATLAPTPDMARRVVAALTADLPGAVSSAEVDAAFARHGGNMREMLFELYDRYEQRRVEAARSGSSPLSPGNPG